MIQPAPQIKSLNRRWKEDGKTVSFKEYAERFDKMNATGTAGYINNYLASSETIKPTPLTTPNNFLGIPTWLLIGSGVLIAGAIVFVVIRKKS